MVRRKRHDPAVTKARILESAAALFAEKGFAGTRTRDIARRARVNLATVHFHWQSKKRLYLAVYEQLLAQRTRHSELLFTLVGQAVLSGTSRRDLVAVVVEHLMSFYHLYPYAARLHAYHILEAKTLGIKLDLQPMGELLLEVTRQVRRLLPAEVARTVDVELTLLMFNLLALGHFTNPAMFPALVGERDPAALEARIKQYFLDTLTRLFAGLLEPEEDAPS